MKSEAQRRFLHAVHPELAAEFEAATPKGAHLPEHASDPKGAPAREHSGAPKGAKFAEPEPMPKGKHK
jgi:hypothetical protein